MKLPILNIDDFHSEFSEAYFYANDFKSHLAAHQKEILAPHKHDFYLVVVFTQGSGIHEIDFSQYPVKKGALFILRPGQTHYWQLSDDIEGYIFFHSLNFYSLLFPNKELTEYPMLSASYGNCAIQLNKTETEQTVQLFQEILSEYQQTELFKARKLGLLTDRFYIDLLRLLKKQPSVTTVEKRRSTELFNRFSALLESSIMTLRKPTDYADALNISTKHLNRIVNEEVNKSTSQLINERIVLEAKRHLIHSFSSMEEISQELGFEDASYFSRFFKKNTGLTPSDFAKSYHFEED